MATVIYDAQGGGQSASRTTVDNSATRIAAYPGVLMLTVVITNTGSVPIDYGFDDDVTFGGGTPMQPDDVHIIHNCRDSIYAIVEADDGEVSVVVSHG